LFSSVVPKKDGRVKISHLDFVVYLVFNFFTDNKQNSLEGMRRKIEEKTNILISRGSFWERLASNRLKKIMESLVAQLITNTIGIALENHKILELLKITGILIFDSSIITLTDLAEKYFPGTRNKSGIKWHNCFDLSSGKTVWFKLSESRKHDSNFFPPFELLKGKLIIFDLGYFEYQLMCDLQNAGAYFLCRLKANSVVFIEKVVTGFEQSAISKSLLSVVNSDKFQGKILEAIVKTTTKNGNIMSCRAIGFWNDNQKCYHWYLTNLLINAEVIYPLYRLRWQIELVFKACKNSLDASKIPSANPNIIQTLLLATIAAHLSSGTIYEIASNALSEEKCLAITVQRIAFVLVTLKDKFVNCILNPIQENFEILIFSIHHLKNELYDPNYKKRETSRARVYRIVRNIEINCT
jgi:putative transposase